MPSAPYTCAICEAPASIVGEAIVRSCAHHEASVLAHMDAVAYGEGHASDFAETPPNILARLWQKIFKGQAPLACSVCGAPAVIKDGRTLRACAHTEAEVTRGGV